MKKKIAFIGTDWSQNDERRLKNLYGGVSYYRLVKPMEYLKEWYDCTYYGSDIQELSKGKTTDEFYHKLVLQYDLIIVKHIDNPQAITALSFYCKMVGIPLIMDLDDNLYEIGAANPASEIYKDGSQKKAFMAAAVTMCDAVFVSTEPLQKTVRKFNKDIFNVTFPTYVLPNCNDINDFPKNKGKSKYFIIGWQGSTTHNADLKMILPVLDKLMQKYANVYLELVGGVEEKSLKELFKDWSKKSMDKLFVGGGTASWKGYPELLSNQKWNIGLAPLVDDGFNRSKSHIKWMEYATQKIPCIASNVYPYNEPIQGTKVIEHENTGFLCEPNEWEETLEKIILNQGILDEIGQNAYDAIVKNWQWKDHIYKWHDAIEDVLKNYKDQSRSIKNMLRKMQK